MGRNSYPFAPAAEILGRKNRNSYPFSALGRILGSLTENFTRIMRRKLKVKTKGNGPKPPKFRACGGLKAHNDSLIQHVSANNKNIVLIIFESVSRCMLNLLLILRYLLQICVLNVTKKSKEQNKKLNILKKFSKVVKKCDTIDLVKKLNKIGIVADGNFMIGYPDETPDEDIFLISNI